MIMENNPGQPASFVLEQYAIYKAGLTEINSRFAGVAVLADVMEGFAQVEAIASAAEPKAEKPSLTCGYTRRNFKVKPDEAIQDDAIYCCICGKKCQTLTERHIASHNGLSREGYLKLCGYPKEQALMSRNHLTRMKANVLKAQQARKFKQASAEPTMIMTKTRKKGE